MIEITLEQQIAQHYSAAMDSVNLINDIVALKPENMTLDEATDTITRNVQHLEIMVAKTFWQGQDMAPLIAAIAKGKYEPINTKKDEQ